MAFTLAFLALYPERQEEVYAQIHEICHDGTPSRSCPSLDDTDAIPAYSDLNRLPLVLAACYEALRLRDMVMFMPKVAAVDTAIPYTTWDDEGNISHHTQTIKKGSHVILDTLATQRNPFIWKDPLEFNPARQLTSEAKANFVGFSLGPRQCIGKRFAEVEMVAFLTCLLRDFRVVPIRKEGESWEDMKNRILDFREELTLKPKGFGLTFEKR